MLNRWLRLNRRAISGSGTDIFGSTHSEKVVDRPLRCALQADQRRAEDLNVLNVDFILEVERDDDTFTLPIIG